MSRFLGVDVGGRENTWLASIEEIGGHVRVEIPSKTNLKEVVEVCQKPDTLALAIDAQLTFSIDRENGFRLSDEELKEKLGADFRHRVASCNSLMAVPLRGTALAAAAGPFVATVIETHPTACLLLALGVKEPDVFEAVNNYKRSKQKGEDPFEYMATRRHASKFGLAASIIAQAYMTGYCQCAVSYRFRTHTAMPA